MIPHITICWLTNRKQCCFDWFCDSLHLQTEGDYTGIRVVAVDFWAQDCDGWTPKDVAKRRSEFKALCKAPDFHHVPPKPTVWQGKYRLAKINYFAASNARNTGLCLSLDGYVVFVDDLSVLLPSWLGQVKAAAEAGWVACGAFRKVLRLGVEKGLVTEFYDHPPGHDPRFRDEPGDEPKRTGGGHAFGASIGMPVESLLQINGYDEDCDSMSGEDYIAGLMLERTGIPLMYCRKMMTLESEEMHFIEKPFSRIIKKQVPDSHYPDASHAILDWVASAKRNHAPNYQNMRETRAKVLAGEPFPIIQCPEHDWRDGQPIREMDQTR